MVRMLFMSHTCGSRRQSIVPALHMCLGGKRLSRFFFAGESNTVTRVTHWDPGSRDLCVLPTVDRLLSRWIVGSFCLHIPAFVLAYPTADLLVSSRLSDTFYPQSMDCFLVERLTAAARACTSQRITVIVSFLGILVTRRRWRKSLLSTATHCLLHQQRLRPWQEIVCEDINDFITYDRYYSRCKANE